MESTIRLPGDTVKIMAMTAGDWPAVAAIYQEGIDTGGATFETAPPSNWEEWCKAKINACSLVARADESIVGWAALGPASSRRVYAGVAEVSIYIKAEMRGKGIGSRLLEELILASEANGIWTLQAGIFPENQASVTLHLRHGFRVVGVREKLGCMEFGPYQGQWRDVLFLERRSKVIGLD
jgi:L-amino acid N-acyltransferase YncA